VCDAENVPSSIADLFVVVVVVVVLNSDVLAFRGCYPFWSPDLPTVVHDVSQPLPVEVQTSSHRRCNKLG
jgi:hypothetical protein